jgi:hypothetical protein
MARDFFCLVGHFDSVGVGLLTAPLLLQWNVKLEEAFVFTLSVHPP